MLYAPGLLYLHLPRTGGTFVSNLLEKEGVGSRRLSAEIGGHDGIRCIPETVSGNSLVFTTMRDPWSWYVSIDTHYRSKGRLDAFLHELFGKAVSFKEVLRALTHPTSSTKVRLERTARYPGARVPEPGLTGQLANAQVGLYTWMAMRMFCREPFESVQGIGQMLAPGQDIPWDIGAVVDTAQLRDGLSMVLQAWNPEVAMPVVPKIHAYEAQNESSRFRGVLQTGGPDPGLFDAEMQEWVLRADGWLMQRFGFDQPVGLRPPVTLIRKSS